MKKKCGQQASREQEEDERRQHETNLEKEEQLVTNVPLTAISAYLKIGSHAGAIILIIFSTETELKDCSRSQALTYAKINC